MRRISIMLSDVRAKAFEEMAAKSSHTCEELLELLAVEAIEPRKITIKEVASRAKVSPMAVSFVLNGVKGEVGVKKTQRILSVAKKLGWVPSVTAKSLRRGRR